MSGRLAQPLCEAASAVTHIEQVAEAVAQSASAVSTPRWCWAASSCGHYSSAPTPAATECRSPLQGRRGEAFQAQQMGQRVLTDHLRTVRAAVFARHALPFAESRAAPGLRRGRRAGTAEINSAPPIRRGMP